MKQPWEVYFDSFAHHADGIVIHTVPLPPNSVEAEALGCAFKTARESVIYHLIGVENVRHRDAKELADDFFQVSVDWLTAPPEPRLPSLYERLRHSWMDWALRS